MDFFRKKYEDYVLKPYLQWYLKRPRSYTYGKITLKIYPTVFHPGYFFSTRFFAGFLETLNVQGKSFCEIGAGSALVSFFAVKQGAKVLAIELNEIAVRGIQENRGSNNIGANDLRVIHSDLFDSVPHQKFDMVFINPPYFFRDITGNESLAWNCGSGGEFFDKLFRKLADFTRNDSEIYMTLAENCDIPRIEHIAGKHGFGLNCVREAKIKWEKNFIFKVNFI